jgi:hypothetical protein
MATRSNPPRGTRRERLRDLYLAGKSRGPYKLNRSINESLTESSADEQPTTPMSDSAGVGTNSEICTKCHPVLSRYRDELFKSMRELV